MTDLSPDERIARLLAMLRANGNRSTIELYSTDVEALVDRVPFLERGAVPADNELDEAAYQTAQDESNDER